MIKKILILGTTGMLGHAMFKVLNEQTNFNVFGTLRNTTMLKFFPENLHTKLISNIDVLNENSLTCVFQLIKPDVVINCIGLIKQLNSAKDPLQILPINTLLPHRLANLCEISNVRLIHISTDCVFSGKKGNYLETDLSDAEDLYGKSKYLGEIHNQPHVITLRTSIIGHELTTNRSIIDWFLSKKDKVNGFTKAIFSGFPAIELANIIAKYIISNENLHGLYHVSSVPIDKYSLLNLVAKIYNKKITIIPDDTLTINRSLNSEKFRTITSFAPKDWPELILQMRAHSQYV